MSAQRHRAGLVLAASLASGCTPLERLAIDLGFGPPEVEASEIHDANGASWDHDQLSKLLFRIVDDDGYVDYRTLTDDASELDAYIEELAEIPYATLSRDAKLATLINAYNAFTLRLVVDHYPVDSIKDIPASERWKAERWNVGGMTLSLNQIEHQKLRREFVEPRIHFAVNCASVGCPPLARTAYEGERLETDLERAAQRVHDPEERWFDIRPFEVGGLGSVPVKVTRIYLWYADDFRSVQKSIARYHPPLQPVLEADRELVIDYLPYDWSLNEQRVTE